MSLEQNLPLEMPWEGKNVPHGVIEVNQFCNINCFGCCKDKSNYKKSLDEIKKEIDFIASKRNLGALSIAGGEPMVYQDLPQVIAYIKSKGIIPWILSNGTLITKERVEELVAAGLKRILLHIDSEQIGRPDVGPNFNELTLNTLREKYVDICFDGGLEVGFTTMVYRDKLEHFNDVVEFAYSNPKVIVLLVMPARKSSSSRPDPTNEAETRNLPTGNVSAAPRSLSSRIRLRPIAARSSTSSKPRWRSGGADASAARSAMAT